MPKTYPTPVPPPARSGNPQELEEQTRTRRAYLEALTPLQDAELRADEADARATASSAGIDALREKLNAATEKIERQDAELTELRQMQSRHESTARNDLTALTRAIANASTPQAMAHAAAQIAGAIATEAIAPPAGRSLLYALQIALSAARSAKQPARPKARKEKTKKPASRKKPRKKPAARRRTQRRPT
jgi:chromosome segregation ATPase